MKNMNVFLSTLFRWQPCRETLTALVAGALVIALSAAMLLCKEIPWAGIAIRDMGQIFLLGILFPITTIQRAGGNWAGFGLHFKKWPVFLSVNLFLGALLFMLFLSESPPPPEFALNPIRIWTALYVMLALCFELVFFYAFLRTRLERAFGMVPAIILTAVFYAFHHIGFQPEYGKLIFVGLLYAAIYRAGNSALLIFPFFLGVGGVYDVLIQSQVVSPVLHPAVRTMVLAAAFLAAGVWLWRKSAAH